MRHRRLLPYLMLAPMVLTLGLLFGTGLLSALVQSLGYLPAVGLHDITFMYYRTILQDPVFLSSLSLSFRTSLVSAAFASILGVAFAVGLVKLTKGREAAVSLARIPLIVPHVSAVLLIYSSFSRTGMVPRLFYAAGFIRAQGDFPMLLYGQHGGGIILAYLWKEIPFVAFMTYAILSRVSGGLEMAARSLGATRRQAFIHVKLPVIAPTVFSAFLIVFAFSFGAYEVPLLLGPTMPRTLPVLAYTRYTDPFLANRPYAMAINVLIALFTLLLSALYVKVFRKVEKDGQ